MSESTKTMEASATISRKESTTTTTPLLAATFDPSVTSRGDISERRPSQVSINSSTSVDHPPVGRPSQRKMSTHVLAAITGSAPDVKVVEEDEDGDEDMQEEEEEVIKVPPDVPEYTEAMKDQFEDSVIIKTLYPQFPNLEELKRELDDDLSKNFRRLTVENAMLRMYDLLLKYRATVVKVSDKLDKRENELLDTIHKARFDPRINKMLKLAETWRNGMCEMDEENMMLRDEMETLEFESKGFNNTMAAMHTTINRLKKELERARMMDGDFDIGEKLNNTMMQNKDLIRKRAELEQSLAEMKEAYTKLQKVDDYANLEAKHAILEKNYARAQLEREELLLQKESLTNLVVQKHKNADNDHKLITDCHAEMEDLSTKFEQLKSYTKMLDVQIHKMSNQLQNKTKESDECHIQCQQYFKEAETLKRILHHQDNELTVQKRTIKDGNLNLYRKDKQIEKLSKTVTDLRAHNTSAFHEKKHLTEEVGHLKDKEALTGAKLKNTLGKNLEAQRKLDKEQQNVLVLVQRTTNLMRSLDETTEAIGRYQQTNEALHLINGETNNKLVQLNDLYEEQAIEMQNCHAKIATLVQVSDDLNTSMKRCQDTVTYYRRLNQNLTSEAYNQFEETRNVQKKMLLLAQETETAWRGLEEFEKVQTTLKTTNMKLANELAHLYVQHNLDKKKMKEAIDELQIERQEVMRDLKLVQELNTQLDKSAIRETLITQQRDIFAAKVVQANVEHQLMVMKMDRQDKALQRGKTTLQQVINDNSILKKEIKNLRHHLKSFNSIKDMNATLRGDLVQANKDLQMEYNKRAELENIIPTRIHRYRDLLATHPKEYELVLKSQRLVRCLIRKTDMVVGLEQRIVVLQRDLMAMKSMVAIRSAPNLASNITVARAQVREKNKQVKALVAEANMNRYNMERLKLQNTALEHKIIRQKSERTPKHHKQPAFGAIAPQPAWKENNPRRFGGGFHVQKQPTYGARHMVTSTASFSKKRTSFASFGSNYSQSNVVHQDGSSPPFPEINHSSNTPPMPMLPGQPEPPTHNRSLLPVRIPHPPHVPQNSAGPSTPMRKKVEFKIPTPELNVNDDYMLDEDISDISFSDHESDEEELRKLISDELDAGFEYPEETYVEITGGARSKENPANTISSGVFLSEDGDMLDSEKFDSPRRSSRSVRNVYPEEQSGNRTGKLPQAWFSRKA